MRRPFTVLDHVAIDASFFVKNLSAHPRVIVAPTTPIGQLAV